jgi:hypothetical protein
MYCPASGTLPERPGPPERADGSASELMSELALETARRIIPAQSSRAAPAAGAGVAEVRVPPVLTWAEDTLSGLLGGHEQLPPAFVASGAVRVRRAVERTLRGGLARDDTHRAALARGRSAVLQADAVFKLGDPDRARRLAAGAYAVAATAGEGPLLGSAREIGAVIEFYAGQPGAAARLAEDGLRHVSDGPIRARLLGQQARAYAALGDLGGAVRALDEAYGLVETISPELWGRPGLSFTGVHPVEIPYNATTALCLLARPRAAAEHAAAAMPALDELGVPGFRSVIRLDLALAKARSGRLELDEACALAADAIVISWDRVVTSVSSRANQLLEVTRGQRQVRAVGELASLVREWQRRAPAQRAGSASAGAGFGSVGVGRNDT